MSVKIAGIMFQRRKKVNVSSFVDLRTCDLLKLVKAGRQAILLLRWLLVVVLLIFRIDCVYLRSK